MGATSVIFAVAAGVVGCSLLLAVAFGRSSARSDENVERLRADYMRELSRMYTAGRLQRRRVGSASAVSYAGLRGLTGREKISRQPSITIER